MNDEVTSSAAASAQEGDGRDLLISQLVSVESVTFNLSQAVVVTTEDKLKLCLQRHLSEVEKSRDWVAPFSLLISLILALITTEFKDFVLPKATWSAVFIISAILSGLWFLFVVKNAFTRRTVESLISEIKADSAVSGDQDRRDLK